LFSGSLSDLLCEPKVFRNPPLSFWQRSEFTEIACFAVRPCELHAPMVPRLTGTKKTISPPITLAELLGNFSQSQPSLSHVEQRNLVLDVSKVSGHLSAVGGIQPVRGY
jgi:hypothetical protein